MSESKLTIKRGEVWLIKFKKQDSMGTEIYKTRPAAIFSTQFYNEGSKRVIALPLSTTIQPLYKWEIPVMINNRKGKIMVDQIRSFDKEKRLIKKIGELSPEILEKAEQILSKLVELKYLGGKSKN
ncbi:MAG: type II toxin-antitoxin system PemK/MazF family toxin [Candidatus Moeniiplasma glomeromycotorum]|nr:type II toxin-antitoxin system PemK/MazF family toxin [Candidatus Moeniiplasma glomeromycotorum]MCE8167275.1 type II toxin-antitoxin system PemK/MazF family toxin [Candidatus Moeniiplasma glomeromycotorum]MCE8168712.1 type II toxin-antitoxin system PemK/MazF family toxin [Candidatus Moeniiplasma glomeromycotorum]